MVIVALVILIAASLAGGAYFGYQSGYENSHQLLEPELQRQINVNANITKENEALRSAMPSIIGKTIKIGCIAPDTTSYTSTKSFIEKVIQPDLNAYASGIGYNVSFEFIVEDAEGQAPIHLELVKDLHNSGVDIFIGGFWTSQGTGSLNYVNANKMLMVSPSSTIDTYALANDRFYRMSPADNALPLALADVIWSYGIKELVVLQRGDSWGDDFLGIFTPRWESNGGEVAGQVVRYDPTETDFSSTFQQAEVQCEGAITRVGGDSSKVGVLFLAFEEAPQILKQVSQYEALNNLVWFQGVSQVAVANNWRLLLDYAPSEANHVKLFIPIYQIPNSTKYSELEARYVATTGEPFGIDEAYLYDASWVLAKAILETGTDNATKVTAALPSICENFYGASGWCRLNEFGDRVPPPFDVWFYASGATSQSGKILSATYYPDTKITYWNTRG
jgi:branched-chain amino acid transport system substrate-binding protein